MQNQQNPQMVTQNHQMESHNPLMVRKSVTTYREPEPPWQDETIGSR